MSAARWIASGGGIGFFPFAPGTVASAAAIVIGACALWLGHAVLAALIVVTFLVGLWAVHTVEDKSDPGWIVIDEFVGQWIALLGLAHVHLLGLIAAFVLFRLFDITKLGPVGWADRRHDAVGVMADDAIAGLLAAVIVFVLGWLFPRL